MAGLAEIFIWGIILGGLNGSLHWGFNETYEGLRF